MSVKFHFELKKVARLKTQENGFYLKSENAPHVILIHGLTGTPNEMAFISGFLNKREYATYSPRLANHDQPVEILKDSKWQDFYGSVRKAFLAIEATHTRRPIFAAGVCIGGLLALCLAAEFPDRIAGVSCLAPTLFYDGWNVPWYRCLLPLAYYTPLKYFLYFKEGPPYGIKNESLRKRVHAYYQNADIHDLKEALQYGYPYIPVSLLYQQHLLIKHMIRQLPSIHVPVQLIHSEEDDGASIKNSELIRDQIGSEIKELIPVKNSYHLVSIDNDRIFVAQKMADFFGRLSKQTCNDSENVTSHHLPLR